MILDNLNFQGILWLCEGSSFPTDYLHRRHLINDDAETILKEVVETDWPFDAMTKDFIMMIAAVRPTFGSSNSNWGPLQAMQIIH
jgi:hypothetical protein